MELPQAEPIPYTWKTCASSNMGRPTQTTSVQKTMCKQKVPHKPSTQGSQDATPASTPQHQRRAHSNSCKGPMSVTSGALSRMTRTAAASSGNITPTVHTISPRSSKTVHLQQAESGDSDKMKNLHSAAAVSQLPLSAKNFANLAALQQVPAKVSFEFPRKRKRAQAMAAGTDWFDRICPLCETALPVKGWNHGQYYRKKHLKQVHNRSLRSCPMPGRSNNTHRTQMRAKQLQQTGTAHALVHVHTAGLAAVFPKDTPWVCKHCLCRGTVSKLATSDCNLDRKSPKLAQWWKSLKPSHKRLLQQRTWVSTVISSKQ